MPVAKLSREFYEKFGDKLTDELVNCLNSIEAGYRGELQNLFATHFERFEERFEHRLTEAKAELRAEFRDELGRLRVEVHAFRADLIKWTFVFWAPVVLALIGLYVKGGTSRRRGVARLPWPISPPLRAFPLHAARFG